MNTDVIFGALRQHRLAVVFGVVAFAFLILLVIRLPRGSEIERELESERIAVRRIQQNLAAGADLDRHLEILREQVEEINARLMERREVAVNYDYFYRMEEASGVRIQNIEQRAGSVGAAAAVPSVDLFDVIGYSLSVQGTFANIVGFIRSLESGRHFIRIQSVNLGSAAQTGTGAGRLNAQIELNVLGRKP